jgi:hypothetical protein
VLYCVVRVSGIVTRSFGRTRPPKAYTVVSRSLQIYDAGIVVEELAAVLGYLRGDAIWVFNFLLAEFVQDAAETVIPLLLFLGRFAWVCSTKLDKQLFT